MARRRPYLRPIEGARGVAALGVVAYHTMQFSRGHGPLEAATSRFWLGVPLFFVLSGFLLYRPFAHAVIRSVPRPSITRYARLILEKPLLDAKDDLRSLRRSRMEGERARPKTPDSRRRPAVT